MSSWRGATSQQAQRDLDALLEGSIRLAQDRLEKAGEFSPFGMHVAASGQLGVVAVDLGDEPPQSVDMLAALVETLSSDTTAVRACALVADIRLTTGSDAIRVELEHRDGIAMAVALPYSLASGATPTYGELSAFEAQTRVWP